MLVCPRSICKAVSKNLHEYLNHLDSHSITNTKTYQCPTCPNSFKSRCTFYTHMKTHDNIHDQEQQLLCRHCNQHFLSIKDFENHLKSLGEKIKKPCPLCTKQLPSFVAYRAHKYRYVCNSKSMSFRVIY